MLTWTNYSVRVSIKVPRPLHILQPRRLFLLVGRQLRTYLPLLRQLPFVRDLRRPLMSPRFRPGEPYKGNCPIRRMAVRVVGELALYGDKGALGR